MENKSALQKQPASGVYNIEAMVKNAMAAPKLTNERPENVTIMLRYIFGLIGIEGKKLPDEGETMILRDYIFNDMKRYSLDDIRLAFKLYVQGKLDFIDKHYQKFSVLFLENVMQSYNRYRIKLDVWHKNTTEPEEPSDEEKEQLHREASILKFVRYAKTGYLNDPGNATYDYLDRKGLILFSIERKKEIYEAAKVYAIDEQREMMLKARDRSAIKNNIAQIRENGDPAVIAAKKMALKEYFDDLLEIGTTLKEAIDNE